jgi:hypothetical protein
MTVGPICSWCNLPMPKDLSGTAVDHIIPRARGGPDKPWNRQRLHAKCNGPSGKGCKLTPEAERLAAEHGIVLREPLPTAWPGSSVKLGSGKPNPYRIERESGVQHMPSPAPERECLFTRAECTMFTERLAG